MSQTLRVTSGRDFMRVNPNCPPSALDVVVAAFPGAKARPEKHGYVPVEKPKVGAG